MKIIYFILALAILQLVGCKGNSEKKYDGIKLSENLESHHIQFHEDYYKYLNQHDKLINSLFDGLVEHLDTLPEQRKIYLNTTHGIITTLSEDVKELESKVYSFSKNRFLITPNSHLLFIHDELSIDLPMIRSNIDRESYPTVKYQIEEFRKVYEKAMKKEKEISKNYLKKIKVQFSTEN